MPYVWIKTEAVLVKRYTCNSNPVPICFIQNKMFTYTWQHILISKHSRY